MPEHSPTPLSIRSWPQAIAHIDGDAFFASCEQAMNPRLRGKAVVTGQERGIASAMSYEAKARGVTRGMPIHEIKRVCPEAIIVPSNYEAYSLYASRMYSIVRRYTPEVEEYSIDECFADLTGLRRSLRMSYPDIATAIKRDLDTELGFTFSIGLAPTKVLAKVASKWDKPSGCISIRGKTAHEYLSQLPVGGLWGIGPQTSIYLQKLGLVTAYDFARQTPDWVKRHLSKPYQQIHQELRSQPAIPLVTTPKIDYKSISKTKTFTPPSTESRLVFAQLCKNIENACTKARRYHLRSRHITLMLKTQAFRYHAMDVTFSRAIHTPDLMIRATKGVFDRLFQPNTPYRATGVILRNLQSTPDQPDLFGEHATVEATEPLFVAIDALRERYGKHTIFLGGSFFAMQTPATASSRQQAPARHQIMLPGETKRRRVNLPVLGTAT